MPIVWLCVILFVSGLSLGANAAESNRMDLRLGGCGGVYFYASAGEFWVEVQKQDLYGENMSWGFKTNCEK